MPLFKGGRWRVNTVQVLCVLSWLEDMFHYRAVSVIRYKCVICFIDSVRRR